MYTINRSNAKTTQHKYDENEYVIDESFLDQIEDKLRELEEKINKMEEN